MSAELNQKVLSYADVTGRALHLAGSIAESHIKKEAAAKARVERAVDVLKRAGLIEDYQDKEAADQLSNHASALDVLVNVVDELQRAKTASADIGRGVADPRQPAPAPQRALYLGKRSSEVRPSDECLLRLLNR